jgi:hypothetical protein
MRSIDSCVKNSVGVSPRIVSTSSLRHFCDGLGYGCLSIFPNFDRHIREARQFFNEKCKETYSYLGVVAGKGFMVAAYATAAVLVGSLIYNIVK